MPRTGLNRHERGYATKEAGSAVHFPVSGPIGLARSHILIPYPIVGDTGYGVSLLHPYLEKTGKVAPQRGRRLGAAGRAWNPAPPTQRRLGGPPPDTSRGT